MMTSILWERLDGAGLDRATVAPDAAGYRIAGTALFGVGGEFFDIRYSVIADQGWNTRIVAAHVEGPDGERRLSLRADEDGNWTMGGDPLPELDGIRDVDLAFTPSTKTLPIRRLGLEVGEGVDVDVAHVAFPDRTLQRVTQRYDRIADDVYRYSSGGSSFDLSTQSDGLVTGFPDHWRAIATA